MISIKDKEILRNLAKTQKEYANSLENLELTDLWTKHNTLRGERPMICIEVESFEQEVIHPLLLCEDSQARQIECELYRNIVHRKYFNDDFPVPPYFPINVWGYFKLFFTVCIVNKPIFVFV